MNSESDGDIAGRPSAATAPFREADWERLLEEIEDDQVIPVIGPELLVVESEPPRTLAQVLGSALADSLQMDRDGLPQQPTVTDVAVEYARRSRDPSDLYHKVRRVARSREWPVPRPLLQLASIRRFSLFVSTSFDDLMKRALDDVRFGGGERTRSIAFSALKQPVDLPPAPDDAPVVYQLFGALSTAPDYAVGEEDLLHFTHLLQSPDRRPERLFEQLRTKTLLVLGCSFPDWLMRFLLVSAKGEHLFTTQGSRGVVADQRTRTDAGLLSFLERRGVAIYPDGDGGAFVDELARRCQKPVRAAGRAPAAGPDPLPEFEPDCVFISYASEDRAAAVRFRDALSSVNIVAWLDTRQLQMGDAYEEVICRNIAGSALFFPLLSRHTTTPNPRFFRVEWRSALKKAERHSDAYPFILPVAIDDVSPDDPNLPREFNCRHWVRCEGGAPSAEVLEAILGRLRAWRRLRAATLA